ncbi:SDR family NAD(P)-dependent oxidoreductase [Paenibacillus daejeonensis]|uniref:SDR family NAD(P)-dependent oxidoreductase n=1 Tax=Paenibacillus daejeonensis TaxID=135193 RepID=UPI00037BAAC7|nr:SDR family NAD(P)-dependent oxidoreductase [Paenibacillus daejeonensis]
MRLAGKKTVVTGACGFIGSHLTERLVRAGAEVTAFVMYQPTGSAGWLDTVSEDVRSQIHIVAGDIRDAYAVRKALQGQDLVFHLAALIGIPYSYTAPESYVDTNIKGTLNVLQAVQELGLTRMIHTSTSEVYGSARYVPMSESHPLQGQSPYAATKIGADQLAGSFYCAYHTPVVTIRPFNTYGPRQSQRAVLPTIISQLISGETVLRLGSLQPTRDFTYVQDTVSGFLAAADATDALGETINLGSGFEISIGEVAELAAEALGVSAIIETDRERLRPENSEVTRLCADNSKAQRLLHWAPDYGGREGLRRGLLEMAEWLHSSGHLAHYAKRGYHI